MTTGLQSFEIPYGSLVPLEVEGLVAAGRIISQTHEADMWTRVLSVPALQRELQRQGLGLGSRA